MGWWDAGAKAPGGKRAERMIVSKLIEALAGMPQDAIVLMDNGAGLSRVDALELIAEQGPGAPAEVILQPNMDE
jgi:hypothetical protein